MKKRFLIPIILILSLVFLLSSCEDKEETTIVFDIGNGETKSYTVEDFSKLEIPDDPKRDGYVFDGWYFDNGYTEAFTLTALSLKEKGKNLTIYSKWTAYSELEFKYEFYLDGAKIGEETVKGMKLPETENASKTGYVFLGWYLDEAFEIPFAVDKIKPEMADSATKLYAKMKPLSECEFNLQFTVDGAVYSKVLTTGTAFTYPAPPEKSGYAFGGWYLDDSFENQFTADDLASCSVSEPVIIYAKFIKLTAVNFYIGETLYATKYTHDGQITLPESPEKENYAFGGWYLDVDYKTVFNLDALASLLPSESVSVYAKFTKVVAGTGYSVKFYIDGELYATGQTTSGKITLPAPPEKEHMTFLGWYYDIAFKYEFDESDYINENKSLYALFENKEIIATLKNGDSISSTKITYGESYTLTKYSLDTENKKRFLGWAVEGSDTLITDNNGNSLSPSAFDKDVTLTAVWDSYLYRLGIYVPGEEKAREYFLKSDRLDFIVSDLMSDKWYYTFAGWYTDRDEKIDVNSHIFTEDLMLTAKFVLSDEAMPLVLDRRTQYEITFANGFPKNGETYKAICDFNENVLGKYFFGASRPMPYTESYYDSPLTSGYEILIGPDALFRGDECCINSTVLGETGYVIKIVGNIIVIAGGSDAATKEAFLKFTEDFVTLATKADDPYLYRHLLVKADAYYEKKHEFAVESVTVDGVDLSEFTVCVRGDYYKFGEKIRDLIYDVTGYYLDVDKFGYSDKDVMIEYGDCTCDHRVFINHYQQGYGWKYPWELDEDGDGFVVYVKDGDIILQSYYSNAFEKSVEYYFADAIKQNGKNVSLPDGYTWTKRVCEVRYEDFGAVGDGVTDDFEAIYNTHIYANSGGQKVLGKEGATYYIGESFTKTIPVKTSVDFCGANIIIDDTGNAAYQNRGLDLFTVCNTEKITSVDYGYPEYSCSGVEIYKGDSFFGYFDWYDVVVRVINDTYINDKYPYEGWNAGVFNQSEIFSIDENGYLINGDGAYFTFDDVRSFEELYPIREITIENAIFTTVRADSDKLRLDYNNSAVYHRGIKVVDSVGVTIRLVSHAIVNEPDPTGTNAELQYAGFLYITSSYDVTVQNCDFTAHSEYKVNKLVNGENIDMTLTPRDIYITGCSDITLDGIMLYNYFGLTDTRYAHVLEVDNTKGFVLKNSTINGMDLVGIWGTTRIENSTVGRVIELVGGGELIFDTVTRVANKSFIELEYWYGAYYNGNITFKNCEMKGEKAYNSNAGESASTGSFANLYLITSEYAAGDTDYASWKCKNDRTMPYTVTIEGDLTVREKAKVHVFQDIPDSAFDPSYDNVDGDIYTVTEKIIFKGAEEIAITNGSGTVLNSIEVANEE